jgi:hypothetical protein
MNRFSLLILVLLIGILLISCEKDKIPQSNTVIGTYDNMIVTNYDTFLIGAYYHAKSIEIDINDDSIKDIALVSVIWGSPGLGMHPRSEIYCLHNNIKFSGYFTNDTTFLHRWTRILEGANNTTEIYMYNVYSGQRNIETGTDQIANTEITEINRNRFKIIPKNKGEIISESDVFKSDSLLITDSFYSYPTFVQNSGSDSVTITYTSYHQHDINAFPLNVVKYIEIKLDDGGKERFGWVKLCIIDGNKILLLECALNE